MDENQQLNQSRKSKSIPSHFQKNYPTVRKVKPFVWRPPWFSPALATAKPLPDKVIASNLLALYHKVGAAVQWKKRICYDRSGVCTGPGQRKDSLGGGEGWYNGKPNRKEHNVILPAFIKRHTIPGFQQRRKNTLTPAKNQSIPTSCPFLPLTSW